MRQENMKMKIKLKFPFERQDKNGVIYSRSSVERAILDLHGELPILYRDNGSIVDGTVIGCAYGETASMLWDEKRKICEVVFDAVLFFMNNGIVTDFEITALGISK